MRRWISRRGVVPAVILTGLAALLHAPAVKPDVRPLTLYEKTGRAPLIVWGEITDGEHRYAVTHTLEVPKCDIPECPGDNFRIVYKLDSFLRKPWQDKIEFRTGERVLLFLRKFTKQDGREPEGDQYTLMWGAQGKVLLPEEGGQAYVDAVREATRILNEEDLDEQERMLIAALSSRNPLIAETAFEEMLKQGLGTVDLVPELIAFFDHQRDTVRVLSMRLLRRILSDARVAGDGVLDLEGLEELSDIVRGRAVLDPSAPFRVESVLTLTVLGGDQARALLERLAEEDASQLVRYEAERALLSWETQ